MLALSRKKGETIVINDDIEVVVLGIQGDQVKLGIKAPRNIPIYRKEIYDMIQEENIKALTVKADNSALEGLKELLNKNNENEE